MNRAVPQTGGRSRARDSAGNARLDTSQEGRGSNVDGLFKERTVERIGLVEQRQHAQRAVMEQPFDRELAAGDEALDQDPVVRLVALRTNLGQLQHGAEALER